MQNRGPMKYCEDCGNKITYASLFFTIRFVQCSECGAKYKVNIGSYLVFIIMVGFAVLVMNYFIISLSGISQIISIIAIFVCVFILAPFNQKLVKCK
jgi:CXXC-20-CXXC protein